MLTVREAINLMPDVKEFELSWTGLVIPFNPKLPISMEAYGDFVVGRLCPCFDMEDRGLVSIEIDSIPRKAVSA